MNMSFMKHLSPEEEVHYHGKQVALTKIKEHWLSTIPLLLSYATKLTDSMLH